MVWKDFLFIHCQICQPESRHKNTYILHSSLHRLFLGRAQRTSVNALELLLGWTLRLNLIISVHNCNYIMYIHLCQTCFYMNASKKKLPNGQMSSLWKHVFQHSIRKYFQHCETFQHGLQHDQHKHFQHCEKMYMCYEHYEFKLFLTTCIMKQLRISEFITLVMYGWFFLSDVNVYVNHVENRRSIFNL